ncbi:FOP dimerization domain-containing protein [Spironucleus salmonicida]|uniref:FOP dimerization domain-containing protein n=1 Tax=Spironucleus salmonicida TaxID=348837 RepID=V6LLS5_9EUKA|nr:FOP dimerization domain-containing protein [Spironucleus salmonicida]|eukprot:EST45607.1 FOP dimerization domain-containing protein [Spironucleus salmonicida]
MDEIRDLVVKKMKQENTFSQLKAAVRASTEQILSENRTIPPPAFESEHQLLLEVIGEFFRYVGLNATASALESEAGTTQLSLRRDFLIQHVGLNSEIVGEDTSVLHAMYNCCQQFGKVEAVIEEEQEDE